MVAAKIKPVSSRRPCPVCAGQHKCSTTADGLILCGRSTGEQPGFRFLGEAADPTWNLYREAEEPQPRRAPPTPPAPAAGPPSFPALVARFAADLTAEHRARLAGALGLPVEALANLPDLGWDAHSGAWAFPEIDGRGDICGIGLRFPDGTKRCISGSHRGLLVPCGFPAEGPVFVVEGMSDAIALAYVGLAAIGRPGAKAGIDLLAAFLAQLDPARPILIITEYDLKPDGRWPGREGADFTAERLRKLLKGRTILICSPPEGCKDAREWVVDRLQPYAAIADAESRRAFAREVGRDISTATARGVANSQIAPMPKSSSPFPVPLPITQLASSPGGGVPWLWDGYIARGRITLLAALPKAGKTTLLTHLLRAFGTGGTFCGRALLPAEAVVITEESPEEWANRRDALGLTDRIRILPRPFFGKPHYDEWLGFLTHLIAHLDQAPADVVILDTLADLWPAKDENSAVEVHAALQPLRKLAEGRAVVCVHHMRKSDGGDGTASRGSGALAGFVDVIVELRRASKSTDPHGVRRELKALGRMQGIPAEWLVELDPATNEYRAVSSEHANGADAKREKEDGRKDDLRHAILAVLPRERDKALTREEIWGRLPEAVKVNEKRFWSVLEAEVPKLWLKEGSGGKNNAYRYWLPSEG